MRQSWHEDAPASAAKNEVAKSVPPSLSPSPRARAVSFPLPLLPKGYSRRIDESKFEISS